MAERVELGGTKEEGLGASKEEESSREEVVEVVPNREKIVQNTDDTTPKVGVLTPRMTLIRPVRLVCMLSE